MNVRAVPPNEGNEVRRDGRQGDGAPRSVRRAAHVPCWWKSSQTALQAGSEAKGGGNSSSGVDRHRGQEGEDEHGDGLWRR